MMAPRQLFSLSESATPVVPQVTRLLLEAITLSQMVELTFGPQRMPLASFEPRSHHSARLTLPLAY